MELFHSQNEITDSNVLVLGREEPYFVFKKHSDSNIRHTEHDIIDIILTLCWNTI